MEIRIPNIGDFESVPVIEIHVSDGDVVAVDDPLVTLESDKATMDVPSPAAGTVAAVRVSLGDRVSEGDPILDLQEESAAAAGEPAAAAAQSAAAQPAAAAMPAAAPSGDLHAEVLVLGAGVAGLQAIATARIVRDLEREVSPLAPYVEHERGAAGAEAALDAEALHGLVPRDDVLGVAG